MFGPIVMICAIVAIFALVSLVAVLRKRRYRRDGIATRGRALQHFSGGGGTTKVLIDFYDTGQRRIEFVFDSVHKADRHRLAVGNEVRVLYLPHHPQRALVDRRLTLFDILRWLLVPLLIIAAMVALLFVFA